MVNQTRLVELAVGHKAVPTPSLALEAQRGSSPGLPGAGRGLPSSEEGRAHATKRLSSFATGGAIAAARLASRGCDVFCLVIMATPCQIRISASPLSSSTCFRKCAGDPVRMTSSVGRTWASRRWPPRVDPSERPTTT